MNFSKSKLQTSYWKSKEKSSDELMDFAKKRQIHSNARWIEHRKKLMKVESY
ncbi:15987_t:CDS:2 [Gigaspora rosea]|nr:15987_t:CDS:2 [Gigaspora rosea]